MAVHQAVEAFRLFTGLQADAARMRRFFESFDVLRTGLLTASSTLPTAAPASRTRLTILGLISVAVAINYLDRAVLGIAAPLIQDQFALNPAVMGVVFSAFSWTYFLGQVPSGVAARIDSVRGPFTRFRYSVGRSPRCCSRSPLGLPRSWGCVSRSDFTEAPCFPANSNVVAKWFPRTERGRAIGVYTAAEYVGLSFMSPVLFWILNRFGWRALFGVAGGIGVVAACVFAMWYRDPVDHPTVSRAELAYVAAGGGDVGSGARPVRPAQVRALFRHRQMWGLCIGQYAVYSTFVFFLTGSRPTWPPNGTWTRSGSVSSRRCRILPGSSASCSPDGGRISCSAGGPTLNTARKLPVIAGLIGHPPLPPRTTSRAIGW